MFPIRQLMDGLEVMETKEQIQRQIDQIIAKLQRKKRNMNREATEHFVSMTGGKTPDDIIAEVEKDFKTQGGFAKINKVFRNQLENIVMELNEYLYDDGGAA